MGDRMGGVLASVSVHRLVEICNSQRQICDLHFEVSSTCQIVENARDVGPSFFVRRGTEFARAPANRERRWFLAELARTI